jgi:hypothetical protein
VYCNSIKGGKGGGLGFDCWALLPGENDLNVGISVLPRLAESKAQGSIHHKQLPMMSSSTSNAR